MYIRLFTSAVILSWMLLPGSISGYEEERLQVPAVHDRLSVASDGRVWYGDADGDTLYADTASAQYTLSMFRTVPIGTEAGVRFDFGDTTLNGSVYYGLRHDPTEVRHVYPMYRRSVAIEGGAAEIEISGRLSGVADFTGWQRSGVVRLGYRVIDDRGRMLYDGKIVLEAATPFRVIPCIIEGPFVNLITDSGAVISYTTSHDIETSVTVNGKDFADPGAVDIHEIPISGLAPATAYDYTITCGEIQETYDFRTAPAPGSRRVFTFAYASDGRAGYGGGERSLKGVNAYIMKKIGAMCTSRDVRFLQFTGDLINGYSNDPGEMDLEYVNWKRAVEPYAHYIPFVAGFGNHESLEYYFSGGGVEIGLDRFPFDEVSSEAIFARHFVNPRNGPSGEDGAVYDPDPSTVDFPPYDETVFYYIYDNVAMISLNSNYWYSWSITRHPEVGGNLHGYIMDNQLAWFESVLAMLEADDNVDHVFVTLHTPIFPNGGHADDDMWYNGFNAPRPYIAGRPVEEGIIERRDRLLDAMMNRSSKVRAVLTGDEHNYWAFQLTRDVSIYTDSYAGPRIEVTRPIWMISDGSAGAPYYGQEQTPWSDHLRAFSTQHALVLFHVEGKDITVEVVNPDTLEEIDRFEL